MAQEYEYDARVYHLRMPGQLLSDSAAEETIIAPFREKAQAIGVMSSPRVGGWEIVSHDLTSYADRLVISFLIRRPK